jgi:hypothetical protein
MAMFFPIMIFAISGFEHCIANMAFVPLGLMLDAEADYKNWLYQNLLLAIVGNIVGGGLIIGGTTYLLFDWTKPHTLARAASRAAALLAAADRPPPPHPASPPKADRTDRARRVFLNFDTDGDGWLDAKQLALALAFLDVRLPAPLARSAVAGDPAGTASRAGGRVDLAGFQGMAGRLSSAESLYAAGGASRSAAALHRD